MDPTQKISPFQVICLLMCGRMFTLLVWKPELPEAGSALLAAVLSPVTQLILIIAVLALLDRLKESGGNGWMHKAAHKGLQTAGLIFFAWAALWSAVKCGSFIASSFYDGRFRLFFIALVLAAGGFAVFQGLEGIARTAPIVLVLAAGGLLLLGLGAAGSMQLRYLPPLTVTPTGTLSLSLDGGRMNFELAVLIFLQPYATKRLRKSAIAVWLGLSAALSVTIMLTVMLCLGYYAQGVEYPVLAVARCARFAMLDRPDPVLMGIWVLLGLVKTSVFLFLSAQLGRQLFIKRAWAWRQKGAAVLSLLLCTLMLSGCGRGGDSIGAKTIVTMLELEGGDRCTVRAEYRIVNSSEGEADYGIYTAEGDTPRAALAAIERKESVRLFTESCRVVTIHDSSSAEAVAAMLEELNEHGGIRPLTAIFIAEGELLPEDKEKTVSIGRSMEKLFIKNGGLLAERYTLKDSIACLRDPELTLTLPVVTANDRGDGVWFLKLEQLSQTT